VQGRAFGPRKLLVVLSLCLPVALLAASDTRAAEPRPQGSGFVVRGAAGVAVGGFDVGGESESKSGFAGGALLGLAGRRFEFDFEIAAQPFGVDNPGGGEMGRDRSLQGGPHA